ncbi:MAG: flagellar assembly peptidoglycan hydrolase FlgJ [Gammaproteobacteria bacterium]|nr:flagellar assembly peptidoglycan hydrolase FlgJ [Gammaproteobacteria bacterium]
MMQATQPELYMNMQQFSELKLEARQHSADAGKKAAQQFEGLFIQMMLKNMRAAAKFDDSQHSSYMDFYTDMYDKQIAQIMSQQGGIGIAGIMQQQLDPILSAAQPSRQEVAAEAGHRLPSYRLPEVESNVLPLPEMSYQASNPAVKTHEFNLQIKANVELPQNAADSLQSETVEAFYGWQAAETFVQDLWPHAQQAAAKLGVSAQVLVAQSALETGWGRHTIKKPDGSVAFNLFGIKAGNGWAGQSVHQHTLEFRSGSMQRESASFRAYDSIADALDDYVSFVQQRPRYAEALQHAGDDMAYIDGLHQAGYATDPEYASKIHNIMQGQTIKQALAELEVGELLTPQASLRQEQNHG